MKQYQADFSLNRKQRSLLFYVICVQCFDQFVLCGNKGEMF